MPSYKELLHMLNIKSITYSTIWRWMKYLGYIYDNNKRIHYIDGHEREKVVKDRNESLLIDYFRAGFYNHRCIQIQNYV